MTIYHYYLFWAAGYACYTLGMMHAKGHTHWKNVAVALATGLLWPAALCYGIYAVHFKTPNADLSGRTRSA